MRLDDAPSALRIDASRVLCAALLFGAVIVLGHLRTHGWIHRFDVATACVRRWHRPWSAGLALAMACGVASGRIHLNAHCLSDVVGSTLLAASMACAACALRPRQRTCSEGNASTIAEESVVETDT